MSRAKQNLIVLSSKSIPGGVLLGLNGQTITGNSSGAWAIAANGTNQSITLTPSGTAAVQIGAASSFTFAAGYGELAITGTSGGLIDFERTAATAQKWRVGSGIAGGSEWSVRDVTGGASPIVCPVGTGHLLLGGLTTDGTGVLQFPAATTSAGGITMGTDVFLYRFQAGGLSLDNGAGVNTFRMVGTSNNVAIAQVADATTVKFGSATTGTATVLISGNGSTALTLDSSQGITTAKKIVSYNGITTAGWGVSTVQADGTIAGTTNARAAAAASYTVGAADGTFIISGNVLVTTSTTHSFSLDCSYTDESNVARVLVLPLAQLAGTFVATGLITNITGAGPYESAAMTIRCKASTAITVRVSSGGTYTTVVYNSTANIRQVG